MNTDKVNALWVKASDDAEGMRLGYTMQHHYFTALLQREMEAEGWRSPEQMKAIAQDALDDVSSWSAYCDDYFKDKWNLLADLEKWAERAGTPLRSANDKG